MTARPMEEERLEPCPFCGRRMTLRPDGYYRHAFQRRGPLCVAEFLAVLAGDPASAEKWNTRSDSATASERRMAEALEKIRRTPSMPFPDPGAHSWQAYAMAVRRAWSEIQNVAYAALSPIPTQGDEQARSKTGEPA